MEPQATSSIVSEVSPGGDTRIYRSRVSGEVLLSVSASSLAGGHKGRFSDVQMELIRRWTPGGPGR